jgi:hypothetical protein
MGSADQWIKPRLNNTVVYFVSVIGLIILINTALPRFILSAMLGQQAGTSLAGSFQGFSRDLFLLLLVTLYFEWARSRGQLQILGELHDRIVALRHELVDSTPEAVRSLAISSTAPEELITTAVDRHLLGAEGSNSIAAKILSSRPAYRDVSIRMMVNSADARRLTLSAQMRFTAEPQELAIGLVRNAKDATSLSLAYPDLLDVFSFPAADFSRSSFGGASFNVRLSYRKPATNLFREIKLRPSNPKADLALRLPDGPIVDGIILLQAMHPAPIEGLAEFRIDYEWEQDPSVRYLYWYADRPVYLEDLTFDVRGLGASYPVATFQSFLGGTRQPSVDPDGRLATLHPGAWILDGHGAIMFW